MNRILTKTLTILMVLCTSYGALADEFADDLGLTLFPVPVTTNTQKPPLVIFMSGDGGWANLDKGLSRLLQQQGWPVVGWSSLTYYWKQKDPKRVAQDTMAIIDKYEVEFGTQKVLFMGYSFGAEIIPFVLNNMPFKYQQKVMGGVLLSPSLTSDFEIHVSEIVTSNNESASYLTLPEVNKQKTVPMLCLYGKDDAAPQHLCPAVKQSNVTVMELAGGHSFDDDYKKVVMIMKHWLQH